jgi:hypothetical protein
MSLFKKIKDVISASILCLRFPFLYPRNRFDGKHHADILGTCVWKLKQKAIRDILILPKLNREINSSSKFLTFFDYTAKLYAHSKTLTIKSLLETKEIDLSGYCSDKFEILGLRLNFSISGNIIINVIVEPFDGNDTTNYGFGGKRVDFITSKWRYFWYKTISWINEQILDRICILPSYTELDAMEPGWRKAFGIQMCKEIKKELKKHKFLYKYRIVQIKEKFGGLRWYDSGTPKDSKILDIIDKYTQISYRTCGDCGKPATKISKGWIYPYCDNCVGDRNFTEIDKNPFAN